MKIAVIGTGYVGLVAGTGFAESGHQVTCVDRDPERIDMLLKGDIPFYEPGLEELVLRNIEEKRLDFSTSVNDSVAGKLLVFLCVGTPEGQDGNSDMSQVYGAAKEVGAALTGYAIIVSKSTCPVGTVEKIQEIIAAETTQQFDVVSNPEFLKEGAAIDDFMRPDRVVVGCDDVRVLEIMRELYSPFLRTGKPFISMGVRSAELAKYAVNTMLAVRISLINELANIAEIYGADINEVRQAIMADGRIGPSYLFPGLGYGGSCFPKDVLALAELARAGGVPTPIIKGAAATNREQRKRFVERILTFYDGDLTGKRFGIWGASFKPRTDDLRNAPALYILETLLEQGASVAIFDPVSGPQLETRYGDRITVASTPYDAVENADGLIIATEWREFHNPDFERMGELMSQKIVFDGRNIFDPKVMQRYGFRYLSVGRPTV